MCSWLIPMVSAWARLARRRRRWYSAKSASIMIDTDVDLDMDIRELAGRKPADWGGKLGLTRPPRQPGSRSILGDLPMGEDVAEGPVKNRP